jgi:hypothetical protein
MLGIVVLIALMLVGAVPSLPHSETESATLRWHRSRFSNHCDFVMVSLTSDHCLTFK